MNIRPLNMVRDWDWINTQLGIIACEDTMGLVAEDEKGKRLAVCVLDNWTRNSVQGHWLILSMIPVRHGFIQTCVDYIFNKRGKLMVYGMVPDNNDKAKKFNYHCGLTIVSRLKDAFEEGVDYLVMEGRKENVFKALKMEAV